MQVGMQVLGRLLGGCSCPQSLWNKRNLHQASHLQRRSWQMSGQWLTFLFLQDHSARTHGGLVCPPAKVQAAGEYPSLFPSGIPAYFQKSTQLHLCEAYCSDGGNLHPSVHKSPHETRPKGNGTYHFLTALIMDVLP